MDSKCIICGEASLKVSSCDKGAQIFWQKNWNSALVQTLEVSDEDDLLQIIERSTFCYKCTEIVDQIEFAKRKILVLNSQIQWNKNCIEERLRQNHDQCKSPKKIKPSAKELQYLNSVTEVYKRKYFITHCPTYNTLPLKRTHFVNCMQ